MAGRSRRLWLGWAAYSLTLVTWLHTGVVAVPLHNKLAQGYDPASIQRLVRTNWVRTTAWTLRAAVLGWIVWGLPAG